MTNTVSALSSKQVLQLVKEKLGKPYEDLEFLLECLKEVLEENGEHEMAQSIPWINDLEIEPDQFTAKHLQLYSIVFQLLNTVEVNGAVQQRRKKEDEDLSNVNGLWASNLKMMKEQGLSGETISELLSDTIVEPVLTAHPTEAKRLTVLEHHRSLYLLIVRKENSMWTALEQKEIRDNIKLVLERLWRTGEIFLEKPDVSSEVRNVMHYLTNVFPEVLPIVDRRLEQAWEELGFDPELIADYRKRPIITFGNWVGGDRDGHPFVTSDVTKQTLADFRLNAFVVLRRVLLPLVKSLSISAELHETNNEFQKRFIELTENLGQKGASALHRNHGEVFRQFLNLCMCKLPIDVKREHAIELKENDETSYVRAHELISDLTLLQEALVDFGSKGMAYRDVHDVIRTVQTFGFHLAKIDIRQNSDFHDKATQQLMRAASIELNNFGDWSEEGRLEFLNKELRSNRPFTLPTTKLEPQADAVLSCYKVVAAHIDKYGTDGLGGLIVSMTRSVSDLMTVYLLAREGGLLQQTEDGLASKLPVVPLFETIEDLQAGPEIMDKFFQNPITQRSLKLQQELSGAKTPVQMVMVGYSDSNKDGGIFASQYGLYDAQSKLSEIGRKYGVKIRFFHGKGGSISRGAGPTHWFLKALPHGAIQGEMRLTEQGETIEQKYANKLNASFNMEQLVSGTASMSIIHATTKKEPYPLADTFFWIAQESRKKYVSLIENPHFIKFYGEATPIDGIENSRIGSRPARRSGKRTLADLRAIPWVFSWSQSRYNMTSWYGVGSTLEKLKTEKPEEFAVVKEALKTDPVLRYVLTNVDTSMAATNEEIMRLYASLVTSKETHDEILNELVGELHKTRDILDELLEDPFEVRRQNHYHSNLLRENAMDILHRKQVELLKVWRRQKAEGSAGEVTEEILLELLLSINAIAGAMRNTG